MIIPIPNQICVNGDFFTLEEKLYKETKLLLVMVTSQVFARITGGITGDILDVLLSHGPLSPTGIHQFLLQRQESAKTREALYLQLHALVRSGVLQKQGKLYNISEMWRQQASGILSFDEKRYQELDGIAQFYKFSCLQQLDRFLFKFEADMVEQLLRHKSPQIFWAVERSWWNILYLSQQNETLMRYHNQGIKLYSLFSANTILDQWNTKFYRNLGMSAQSGIKLFDHDIAIYGDYVLFLNLPLDLRDKLRQIYQDATSIDSLDIHYLLNTVSKNPSAIPIFLNIYHDPQTAKSIKDYILKNIS